METEYIVKFCLVVLVGWLLFYIFTHLKNNNTCIIVTKKDVAIGSERTSDLTYMYAQHLWPLSSKGSLGCPTYCAWHGNHILRSPPRTCDIHTNCLAVGLLSDLYVMLYQLRYCSGA